MVCYDLDFWSDTEMRRVSSDMILNEGVHEWRVSVSERPAHVRWAWRVYKGTSIHKQMYLQIQAYYTYIRLCACIYEATHVQGHAASRLHWRHSAASFRPFIAKSGPYLTICVLLCILYMYVIWAQMSIRAYFLPYLVHSELAICTILHVWYREAFIAAIKGMCERDRDTMGRISSIILR